MNDHTCKHNKSTKSKREDETLARHPVISDREVLGEQQFNTSYDNEKVKNLIAAINSRFV